MKLLLWIVFFPIMLPVWLWGKGKIGKILATPIMLFYGFFVLAVILAEPPVEEQASPATAQVLAAIETETPTSTPSPTATPTETVNQSLQNQLAAAVEPTKTPTPASLPVTATPIPLPTNTPIIIPTATPTPAQSSNLPSGGVTVAFLDVVDGDTLDVQINGQEERVRLVGMDTPERGQPGYRAATDALRTLVASSPLYLVRDTNDRDNFGRLLRYIYRADDGTFVNEEMVRQGWAQPVEYPPDTGYAAQFRQAATDAAQNRRGFWSGNASDGAMSYALAQGPVNMRRGPATTFDVSGQIAEGTPLTVFGRNDAADWIQVRTPDRSGGWVYAPLFFVNVPVANIPVPDNVPVAVVVPTATQPPAQPANSGVASQPSGTEVPAAAPASSPGRVTLYIIDNYSTVEVLGLRNDGGSPVDISGARLTGSRGDDSCTVPGGTVLQPGEVFTVATGDGSPQGRGYQCGTKAIWNNNGETIYLRLPDGSGMQIETRN